MFFVATATASTIVCVVFVGPVELVVAVAMVIVVAFDVQTLE